MTERDDGGAAMPQSMYQSTVNIAGVDLVVHVLDNGERVFEAEGFEQLMEMLLNGRLTPDELTALALSARKEPT